MRIFYAKDPDGETRKKIGSGIRIPGRVEVGETYYRKKIGSGIRIPGRVEFRINR